jgi:hypothetical protein
LTNGRSPAPAVFDDALFDADVEQASEAGANAARAARKRFEGGGVPRDELRLCEAEEPKVPNCLIASRSTSRPQPVTSGWCSR